MEKKTKVAALYVRNSDPSKNDSVEQQAQVDALAIYAKQQGMEVRFIFRDAISAIKYAYWERPSLMTMWDEAELGSFDVVLCTEFFRLARKSSEQYAIMEYLKRYHVEVVSITEKFEDTAEGRLLHAVQGFLGEVEAEKIRIRTLRGKQHRAEVALTAQGSTPIYGYSFIDGKQYKKERYELNYTVIAVVDGEEWTEVRVVIYCFDECIKGVSLRQIAFALTRMGIPTQRGKPNWSNHTIRQLIKREAYTGVAYNGQWTKDPETNKFTSKNIIRLPDGIYPQIIDADTYETAQLRLETNAELSPRNNRHPNESVMRTRMYCGICGRRMHVKHWNTVGKGKKTPKLPGYFCYVNHGVEEVIHHHSVSCPVWFADEGAWEFALPFIQDGSRMREHIDSMRTKVVQRNHSENLEKDLDKIKKGIGNLYKLAEVADPTDIDGFTAFQDRLIVLEKSKRDIERLLGGVTQEEDKQEKFLAALDRYEAWTATMRDFLEDPDYEVSQDDKISALAILGVKATVYPPEGLKKRIEYTLTPPDIQRFCEFSLTRP